MKYILLLCGLLLFGCNKGKRYHSNAPVVLNKINSSTIKDILTFQKALDGTFKNPESSPLKKKDQKDFTGLDFFPVDTAYYIIAEFVRTPNELPFMMPTTTSRKTVEIKYGEVYFKIDGKELKLNVYQNQELKLTQEYKDYLFLPFSDLTNGEETYGGGRYIDLSVPDSDTIVIDFNKAYNPYCAYNEKYSCPIVPSENILEVAIRAGVKAYKN
ncbi:DUF1684 domain-containing protein [Leptobacterium sp. I13]|uniref:DUF1684 domain-containing protein n=1 Tax=Leptobacterium meishanense TaxID=3128904 RepID=UPI0030EBB29E